MGKTFTRSFYITLSCFFVALWASAQTITVSPIDPGSYGRGSTIGVPIHVDNTGGCIANGNTFRLYLSDAAGSFATKVQIGTYTGFYATFVNGIIPLTTPAGTGYKVMVEASSPVLQSNASAAFTINAVAGVTAGVNSQTLNPSSPEVFGACIGTDNASYPFINNSTAGATVTANFFNEIAQTTEGASTPIPGNFAAKLANYTVNVRAEKGGIIGTKAYTLINNDLYRSIGATGSNTTCANGSAPLTFPITIDDNGTGFKYNYPGLTYKVTWGDGTTNTYRFCDIVNQGNSISHGYTVSSCGNNVGAQKNVFKIELSPVNVYCNNAVIPGLAYARVVTPPKNEFSHPVAACVNNEVRFNNLSDPGQDPANTTSDCKNLNARYTWYVDNLNNPIEIDRTVSQPFRYTFTTTGRHTVILHLQNSNALCPADDKVYEICIQEPPKPIFTVPANTGCLPLAITPTNTSFIDNNCDASNSFRWTVTGPAPVKYQGGTNASSEKPQFLFDVAGVYTIKLSIKTVSCGTIDAPNVETIVVDGPPVAILSPDKNICGINQTFTFDGTAGPTQSVISGSVQPDPGDYVWTVTGGAFEFTGGTTASSQYPQILFKDAAAYTISVKASSLCGPPMSASQVLTFEPAPVIDAGTSLPVCNGNPVPLQGTVTNGTVNNVLWSGGAGTFTNANSLTATYTPTAAEYAAGSVTLTLTGYTSLNAPCNEIPDNITINFQPVNAVNSSNSTPICPGVNLAYDITALQPGSTFNWTVDAANTSPTISGYSPTGSGSTINDILQNSDVNNSAIITYKITATNGTCTSDVFTLTVSVGPKSPVANFTNNLPDGAACGNTTVQFTNTSAPMNGSTFEWDFGDGQPPSTEVNPSHLFPPNADGTDAIYNVILKIVSPCGAATSAIQTITIRPLVPVVSIQPDQISSCIPVNLKVNNSSPGTSKSYTYYLYNNDGNVLVQPPIVTTNKDAVTFDPISTAGNYTLYAVAEGFCGTLGESPHIPIVIQSRFFKAQMFPVGNITAGCIPFKANLFNNSTPGADNYYYTITNTDGVPLDTRITSYNSTLEYTFLSPGTYYVTITATNSCDKSTSPPYRFDVYPVPSPDFTYTPVSGCRELTVEFTNTTPSAPGTQATALSYSWDFGDGQTSALFTPAPHKYKSQTEPYTVKLTATNNVTQCTSTVIKADIITVTPPPGTNFDVKPGLVTTLPNYQFEFVDKTTGRPVNWHWDFGDNTTAGTRNVNHTYADTGKYTVTLKVIDDKGCDSTFKQQVRITGVPGQLYLPNAFQPQGSSATLQKFMAKGSGIAKWNLQIFNKWGQLLWQTSALNSTGEPVEGWDGTFKGVAVEQGTYVWQASATFINGTEWKGMSYNGSLPKRSGHIYLIK